jgi:tetraacyldisaccharide 4'-kinase
VIGKDRIEGDLISIKKKLLPLSWLYSLGIGFRNLLFEMGILKSRSYSTPVISVGNITVGGTGKTPHVEYLIRLLKDKAKVAVLSRGYKRKTSGFVLAGNDATVRSIGDEPFQMKTKFPDITVAVDKKRTRGIERLTSGDYVKDIDVIFLDDAFQHRYVKPGINILLVDYHRLIIYDKLLPAGRLREPVVSKNRADIVIVTKCPKDLKPMEFRVITKAMSLYPYQQLFFSTHEFEALRLVFPEKPRHPETPEHMELSALADKNILLLTGIASPEQMLIDLKAYAKEVTPLAFSDHHNFKKKDVDRINEAFTALPSPKLIITTEKDETRLKQVEGLSDEVRKHLYVLPIKIQILLDQENTFNQYIINYVRKNSRNSILAQSKDDHKSKDSNSTGDRPRTISFRNN